ncbi:hypothetical protein LAZ67_16001473 [Cordylochernes scorpioides]|uniref:RNA-directed DNA polymerase n=1 Tax=Cordylochernes scorpioides TaxID=51811 RepID=A0ABY6LC91_9ARAC|nr:hypothetical protein LAZ67_16001473 [Cordylochernes scorpioides]
MGKNKGGDRACRAIIHISVESDTAALCHHQSACGGVNIKCRRVNGRCETDDHGNADALSRLPLKVVERESIDEDQVLLLRKMNEVPFSFRDVAFDTRRYKILSIVLRNVREDNWQVPKISKENPLFPFYKIRNELSADFGCLQWRERIVIPPKLRSQILRDLHEMHFGIVEMKMIARRYSWWPGIDGNIEDMARECTICQESANMPPSTISEWTWPKKPWHRLHMDLAGLFMGRMFLVIVDAYTKWLEIFILKEITSRTIIYHLGQVFARFGLPELLVTDNGRQFVSKEFEEFTKMNGIRHTKTSPYNQSSNGLADRYVRRFKTSLRKNSGKDGLETNLERFLLAQRAFPQTVMKESPAEILMKRRLKTSCRHYLIGYEDQSFKRHINQLRPVKEKPEAAVLKDPRLVLPSTSTETLEDHPEMKPSQVGLEIPESKLPDMELAEKPGSTGQDLAPVEDNQSPVAASGEKVSSRSPKPQRSRRPPDQHDNMAQPRTGSTMESLLREMVEQQSLMMSILCGKEKEEYLSEEDYYEQKEYLKYSVVEEVDEEEEKEEANIESLRSLEKSEIRTMVKQQRLIMDLLFEVEESKKSQVEKNSVVETEESGKAEIEKKSVEADESEKAEVEKNYVEVEESEKAQVDKKSVIETESAESLTKEDVIAGIDADNAGLCDLDGATFTQAGEIDKDSENTEEISDCIIDVPNTQAGEIDKDSENTEKLSDCIIDVPDTQAGEKEPTKESGTCKKEPKPGTGEEALRELPCYDTLLETLKKGIYLFQTSGKKRNMKLGIGDFDKCNHVRCRLLILKELKKLTRCQKVWIYAKEFSQMQKSMLDKYDIGMMQISEIESGFRREAEGLEELLTASVHNAFVTFADFFEGKRMKYVGKGVQCICYGEVLSSDRFSTIYRIGRLNLKRRSWGQSTAEEFEEYDIDDLRNKLAIYNSLRTLKKWLLKNIFEKGKPWPYYCEGERKNYFVFLMEYGGITLETAIKSRFSYEDLLVLFRQICIVFAIGEEEIQLLHDDFHINNVLVAETEEKLIKYEVASKKIKIPTLGYIARVIDFGNARCIKDIDYGQRMNGKYGKRPCPIEYSRNNLFMLSGLYFEMINMSLELRATLPELPRVTTCLQLYEGLIQILKDLAYLKVVGKPTSIGHLYDMIPKWTNPILFVGNEDEPSVFYQHVFKHDRSMIWCDQTREALKRLDLHDMNLSHFVFFHPEYGENYEIPANNCIARLKDFEISRLLIWTHNEMREFNSAYKIHTEFIEETSTQIAVEESQESHSETEALDKLGVPYFWLVVLKKAPQASKYIQPYDKPVLAYLKDIRVESYEGSMGFSIHFDFDSNPNLENETLTKSYKMRCLVKGGVRVGPEITDVTSTLINWKQDITITKWLEDNCIPYTVEPLQKPVKERYGAGHQKPHHRSDERFFKCSTMKFSIKGFIKNLTASRPEVAAMKLCRRRCPNLRRHYSMIREGTEPVVPQSTSLWRVTRQHSATTSLPVEVLLSNVGECMAGVSLYQIEKLNKQNFETWRLQMQMILIHSDLWNYVNEANVKLEPGNQEFTNWQNKDQKALATIVLSLNPSELIHVKNCKTAEEAWKKIEEVYQPKGPATRVSLTKRLIQMKMRPNDDLKDYLSKFTSLVDNLGEIGAQKPEMSSPKLETLKVKIIEEDQRQREMEGTSSGEQNAFFGNPERKTTNSTKPPNRKEFKLNCYYCGKKGHKAADCWSKRNSKRNNTRMAASLGIRDENILDVDEWCLDSGATAHMCCLRTAFSDLRETEPIPVKLANDQSIEALGTGTTKNSSEIWHNRFGHLNFDDLRKLQRENLVNGLPKGEFKSITSCETCIRGKQTRLPFPEVSLTKSTEPLQLIHSDICGPMRTKSYGGALYFATFIDDFSRMIFTFVMKRKSEIFKGFKVFKRFAEKQTGKKIKAIRSDNAAEYLSSDFKEYLSEEGIRHQLSVEYSPQQNGVAERANRTLVEMTRCFIIQANLPDPLWAELVHTSTYIRNRCPRTNEIRTPYEIFTGRKPTVSHLRIIGCKCFAVDNRPRRGKFAPRSEEYRLVGYSPESKTYRLWKPGTGMIIKSRDVRFLESENSTLRNDVVQIEAIPQKKRGRGRPRYIRTGKPGRPRKEYPTANLSTQELLEVKYSPDPKDAEEALSGKDSYFWRKAMKEEFDSLIENKTWELVDPPKGQNVIGSKWVFRRKYSSDGSLERYKARLVAKGYSQKYGIDYEETFAPVVRHSTIRTVLALAVEYDLLVHQMDVQSAFLNGDVKEEIYMTQPENFESKKYPRRVCKLKKAIYGLKQAGMTWNAKLDSVLKEMGLEQMKTDNCVYIKREEGVLLVAIYVDDLIIAAERKDTLISFKESMKKIFKIKDLGKINYCLGIRIQTEKDGSISIDQEKYIEELLAKYRMKEAKPISTLMDSNSKLTKISSIEGENEPVKKEEYQSLIGSLIYLSVSTRPDIAYAVSALGQFSNDPRRQHWNAAKRVLRYLKGTLCLKITYEKTNETLYGGPIAWESKKQQTVALSSTESEYIALCEAGKEAVYLRALLDEMGFGELLNEPTVLKTDNQGAQQLARNPVHHARTKHIDIKWHYIRSICSDGLIEVVHIPTQENVADILTKGLPRVLYDKHVAGLGM